MTVLQSATGLNTKKRDYPTSLVLAFFLLLYVFLPVLNLSVFLMFDIGNPQIAYGLSLLFIAGVCFILRNKISLRDGVVFLVLIFVSHAVSWYFFDGFHDSLAYFQPSVRRIAEGFNPVRDGYLDLGRAPDNWSENATYFPKAMAYFAASIFAVFGDIHFGKAYHVLLLFVAVFFAWYFAKGETPLKKALWVMMALNPIALTQWTSMVIDGALASLSLISLIYACYYFEYRPLSRMVHAIGVMALVLLFCIKTTGFPFGCIILFCICLHRGFYVYRITSKEQNAGISRREGLRAFFLIALRLGTTIFLLVALMGFHPYITNMMIGKNIFHPLVQSETKNQPSGTTEGLEHFAEIIYPEAQNRVTRLIYAIMSHSTGEIKKTMLKTPLEAPLSDWKAFQNAPTLRTGGMGPLFFILIVTALLLKCVFFRNWSHGWLLLTLFLLIFIQPHAWQMRYAPFLWCVPFVLLLSLPAAREYLLLLPLLIAVGNNGGIFYYYVGAQMSMSNDAKRMLAPHRGETVFLEKSIFEQDGIFDRYDLKQKFINPEEILFYRFPALNLFTQNPNGAEVNMFFSGDLPAPPDFPLVFKEEASYPWALMSEGLAPAMDYSAQPPLERWKSYDNKIKFYMRLDEKPGSDWLLTLKGLPYSTSYLPLKRLSVWIFINNSLVGHWIADREIEETTLRIPQKFLEESFEDPTRLLTLMFRMPEAPFRGGDKSPLGLELKELYLRPISGDAVSLSGQ